MSKAPGRGQTRYVCQSCGEAFLRWEGQCRACSAWNSLVETVVRAEPKPPRLAVGPGVGGAVATSRLGDVGSADGARLTIGIAELDRVLGGGLVPGSVVLVGGEPGIGKSTLLLQAGRGLAEQSRDVLYASAEESAPQVRMRGERLGIREGRLLVLAETDVSRIIAEAESREPAVVVIDSIQA